MSDDVPMTRARLFVLIDAFERDVRAILERFVISEMGEEAALGALFGPCRAKSDADSSSGDSPLSTFLEMREGYDLLNTHRAKLPSELATEVRQLTQNLDRLVGIRNRVMHARPLAAGDSDAAVSLLNQFASGYWKELRRMMAQLHADPTWEPVVAAVADDSSTLHNLPLPDYDDTGLIGRSKEVAELVALLKRRREPVITVTGEGGIGKTALALEVAYNLVDDVDAPFEAILWTSLKYEKLTAFGVREIAGAARDIVGAVQPAAAALDSGFEGTLNDLAELLDGFKVLLVLDNLETISGEEFRTLYDALPDSVAYLITSRIGVGEYERRYPLGVLSDRDSLQLFNQFVRARKIDSLSRLTSETRIRVVHELRYSPLAIKWFALAVDAGKEPLDLIKHQDELLEFCVRSVYADLSQPAQEVLVALAVLGRHLTTNQLVVLLDKPMDTISMGVQELLRGSLVRRESAGSGNDLVFQIVLTETATQFLSRRVQPDEQLQRHLQSRDREFREIQERRAADMAARSLAPVVVRQRSDADAPTCTVLRQALLQARKAGTRADVFEKIDLARRMNPDFWEVDRVEGFIRDSYGDLAVASACYERAYANAAGEDRAVVAHFFAGHLARKIRDVTRAIDYAREANAVLGTPDTGLALGNYLVWTHQFEEGIALLEGVIPQSTGKVRVIAISALSEAWRRSAQAAGDEDRNFLHQFDRAWKGFEIAIAAIESGVVDERLRSTAADCAAVALLGAVTCIRSNIRVPGLPDRLAQLDTNIVRLSDCGAWGSLRHAALQLSASRGAPIAAKRLAETVQGLAASDSLVPTQEPSTAASLVGEIVSVSETYGFIRQPNFPENVFFHGGSVISGGGIEALRAGMLVRFSTEVAERGPRAFNVHPA